MDLPLTHFRHVPVQCPETAGNDTREPVLEERLEHDRHLLMDWETYNVEETKLSSARL